MVEVHTLAGFRLAAFMELTAGRCSELLPMIIRTNVHPPRQFVPDARNCPLARSRSPSGRGRTSRSSGLQSTGRLIQHHSALPGPDTLYCRGFRFPTSPKLLTSAVESDCSNESRSWTHVGITVLIAAGASRGNVTLVVGWIAASSSYIWWTSAGGGCELLQDVVDLGAALRAQTGKWRASISK